MKTSLLVPISIFILCFLVACGGGVSNPPPTVAISASASTVTLGQPVTLTWSSTKATSCAASATPAESDWFGPEPASGSQLVTPTSEGTTTYMLMCAGAGGNTSGSAPVTGNPAALVITSGSPPPGKVGQQYGLHCNQQLGVCDPGSALTATGGVPPYRWGWAVDGGSSLPPGVELRTTTNSFRPPHGCEPNTERLLLCDLWHSDRGRNLRRKCDGI